MIEVALMRKFIALCIVIFSFGGSVWANAPSNWAVDSVDTAEMIGIAYPKGSKQYTKLLTRGELAYAAVNLHKLMVASEITLDDSDRTRIASTYSDSYRENTLFDDEIMLAIKYELMLGISPNTFSAFTPVTREQTATVLFRIAEKSGAVNMSNTADLTRFSDYGSISSYAYDPFAMMVGENVISGKSDSLLAPLDNCTYEEVLAIAVRFWKLMGRAPDTTGSVNQGYGQIYEQSFDYGYGPYFDPNSNSFTTEFYDFSWDMDMYTNNYNIKNIPLKAYQSNEEALRDMVSITVNVWNLKSNGEKAPSTRTLLVHKEIADEAVGIFDEIFSGEERFPIQSVGGYSFRGAGSKSSHNNGLAIDINPDQNYFVDNDGNILVGKFWLPYDNPYSITPDGDVVMAFTNKGWFWAGEGWSSTGFDYMHFSYTGL